MACGLTERTKATAVRRSQVAAAYIHERSRSGDRLVLAPGYCRLGLDYNLEKAGGGGFPDIVYPQWDGFMHFGGKYVNDRAVMGPNPLLDAALRPIYPRLWVVSCDTWDFGTGDILRSIDSQYGGCRRTLFRSLAVLLCAPHAGEAEDENTNEH